MAFKIVRTKRKSKKAKGGTQPFEFGKLMTAIIIGFFLLNFEAIVITSFVLMFMYGDLTPLSELVMGTFAVVGTITTGAVGFYQWKTKCLNIIKIKQSLGMEIKDEDINKKKTSYWDNYDDEDAVG